MRLLLLFFLVTLLAVAGIDHVTHGAYVPMNKWKCEPAVTIIQTNNGPFYYRD